MKNIIDELNNQTKSFEVKMWINTTLKAHFLKTGVDYEQDLAKYEHIIDYLNSDQAPKRLKKMSVKQAFESADKWTKALQKKGRDIIETEDDVKIVKTFKNGFKLVQLISENSYKREGMQMSHCVASYFNKTGIEVYSLRDPINNSHCTIELNKTNNQINQVKGKGNGPIHPDYIKMVLTSLKYFNLEVKPTDMPNLGYEEVNKEFLTLLKSVYSKFSILKIKEKTFLYTKGNFKVKVNE